MSFQIPRRDHFPRPLGDNSPHTPADPEPAPPFKRPVLADYVEARERWVATGDLTALWDMQDNVAAVPAGWGEPDPRPATPVITPAPNPPSITWGTYVRQILTGFAATMAVLWCLLLALGVIR